MVLITIITGTYESTYNLGVSHCSIHGGYKPTYNWGAHIVGVYISNNRPPKVNGNKKILSDN